MSGTCFLRLQLNAKKKDYINKWSIHKFPSPVKSDLHFSCDQNEAHIGPNITTGCEKQVAANFSILFI